MLTATYIHSPGVGPETERSLWAQGATSWQRFLENPEQWKLPASKRALLVPTLEESFEALEARDHAYFAQNMPASQQWRAYREFGDNIGYLDIETNGGGYPNAITVIGLYKEGEMYSLIKYHDLKHFPELVESCSMLVTYNGNGFDIPMLKRAFPQVPFHEKIHVDLCPTLRKLGLRGGLKMVEKMMGIERLDDVDGLCGWDAVRLWREYRQGNEDSLETLLRYNKEDVENLVPLMEYAYNTLKEQLSERQFEL